MHCSSEDFLNNALKMRCRERMIFDCSLEREREREAGAREEQERMAKKTNGGERSHWSRAIDTRGPHHPSELCNVKSNGRKAKSSSSLPFSASTQLPHCHSPSIFSLSSLFLLILYPLLLLLLLSFINDFLAKQTTTTTTSTSTPGKKNKH